MLLGHDWFANYGWEKMSKDELCQYVTQCRKDRNHLESLSKLDKRLNKLWVKYSVEYNRHLELKMNNLLDEPASIIGLFKFFNIIFIKGILVIHPKFKLGLSKPLIHMHNVARPKKSFGLAKNKNRRVRPKNLALG